jgi:thiol-disulfide isomerase/thioredoxin
MSKFLKHFALFAFVPILISGCDSTGGGVDTLSSNGARNASGAATPATASAYPQLASKVADFEFTTLEGKAMKLSDRKGSVLLVNLWGVWCIPCRAEMPHLVEMQNEHRDQGFQVLGLNVGDDFGNPEDPEKMRKFGEEMKLNYELASIPEELTNEIFRIAQGQAVPTSLLIDREGRLRGVFVGGSKRVIGKMKETVAAVVAGQETGRAEVEGGPAASHSGEEQKMELIEADSNSIQSNKQ